MLLKNPLHGSSLVLRQLTAEDASASYLSWMWDMEVTRHLEVRFNPPKNISDLQHFIDSCAESPDTLLLGMFLPDDSGHIGNIKLGPIDRHHSSGDIGLLIGERSEWGKGHGTVAISLLAKYAFDHLGLAKLTAGCYAENLGSLNAFLKAGFQEEGRRFEQYLVNGQRHDSLLFGRINPSINRFSEIR